MPVNETLVVDTILLVLVGITGIAVIQVRSLFAATMLAGLYSLLMAVVWSNMHALDVAFTEAAVGAGITTVLLLGTLSATGRRCRGPDPVNWPAVLICIATGLLLCYGTLDMPAFGDPEAPIHNHRVPKLLGQDVGKVPGHIPLGSKSKHEPGHGQYDHGDGGDHDGGHGGEDHGEDHDDDHGDDAHHEDGDHGGGHHAHPDDDFAGHVPNTVTSLLAAYRGFDTMFETAVIFTAGASLILLLRRREDEAEIVEGSASDDESQDTKGGEA